MRAFNPIVTNLVLPHASLAKYHGTPFSVVVNGAMILCRGQDELVVSEIWATSERKWLGKC